MTSQNLAEFDSFWDYTNPGQTEIKSRELLAGFSENEPVTLELLTQIARAQGRQQQFEEAHATLDEVERKLGKGTSRWP